MGMTPARIGAPNRFSTDDLKSLKVSRDAKIGAASGRSAAMIALEFRLFDKSLEFLLITDMESLGYHVAQVIGMHPCVALCMMSLCLYIRHDCYSFSDNFLQQCIRGSCRKGSFILNEVFRVCVFQLWPKRGN